MTLSAGSASDEERASYVGNLIGGSAWKQVMIVAVLGGTLASLQAAIVSASRISFAMGRDRVFPGWFGQVSPRYQTPWNATILFGLLNIALLWAATLIGPLGTALSDIVSTLGLIAAMFYLLTAGTAVWFYRRTLTSSVTTFWLLQPAEIAALPMVRAAADPAAGGGDYYGPGGWKEWTGYPEHAKPVARAYDQDVQRRLWEASEQLTG